jgi:flagellar basal-body rod modification protein FlgD
MTATSNVTNSPVLSNDLLAAVNPPTTTASTDPNSVQAQQNQFLNLLSVQLQNQDPLNPMDNSQLTSQLAQLSTVTGINQLNATVTSLATSMTASQTVAAANMIGHGVLTTGTALTLTNSQAVYGVNLGTAADDVQVAISDSTGKVVRTVDLGAQNAGALTLGWNGAADAVNGATPATLPDGNYTIAVTATAGGAALTDASGLTLGTVASVSTGANGTQLTLSGGTQVALTDVKATM